MNNNEQLHEDVPVTNTGNNGAGLTDPKLPIKKANIFKRYKQLMSTRKSKDIK